MACAARYVGITMLCVLLASCVGTPKGASSTNGGLPTADQSQLAPQPGQTVTVPLPTSQPDGFIALSPTAAPVIRPTPAPPTAPTAALPGENGTIGVEILFLRGGELRAFDVVGGSERALANDVTAFAATPDGRLLALVRGAGKGGEIWLVGRDGGDLRQLTTNERAESDLSWSPDGLTLVYSSANSDTPHLLQWEGWSRWCAEAEVRALELAANSERTIAQGCEPTFAPDGRRIAFVSPPVGVVPQLDFLGADNAVQMINRKGEHGWSFATANGATTQGFVVYSPAWNPQADKLAYQRFVGYQALVDINITELGTASVGKGAPIGSGAGWMLPPRFAPDGKTVAVVEHNFSDARGFGGYEIWRLALLRLDEPSTITLPSGELAATASTWLRVARVTAAAWSPDGAALALGLPTGWSPDASEYEPLFPSEGPGEIWRWSADGVPEERLVANVDYASPLLWLPEPPAVAIIEPGVRLLYPAAWGLREPTGPNELVASGDGERLVGIRAIDGDATIGDVAQLFTSLVTVEDVAAPFALPDGSVLAEFRGHSAQGTALAGVVRIAKADLGRTLALLYLTVAEDWPAERPYALALLAASGS